MPTCPIFLRCHIGKLPSRNRNQPFGTREDASAHLNTHLLPLAQKRFPHLHNFHNVRDRDRRRSSNPYRSHPFFPFFLVGTTRASCSRVGKMKKTLWLDNRRRPNINFLHSHANQMPPQINNTECDIKDEIEEKIEVEIEGS